MFSNSESEILSGPWGLSFQHSQAWLLMVANILKGKNLPTAEAAKIKSAQIELRRYVVDENGERIDRQDHPHTPQNSIGVVQIAGPMIKYGNWSAWGTDELIRFAEDFEKDPNIIGQVWIIDSGGGAVSAIAPYHEFLRRKSKPVVALADTCASAAYYTGCAADKLYAGNNISAMFGSIGVVATILDFTKYLKDLGIKEHMIYASQSSYKHKSYNEALKGEKHYEAFRKEHLDPIAIQFQEFVKSNRPKLKTDVEGIIEGYCFYAEEAFQNGMIDGILDFEEAVEQVKFLAGARSFMFN